MYNTYYTYIIDSLGLRGIKDFFYKRVYFRKCNMYMYFCINNVVYLLVCVIDIFKQST